MRSGRESEFAQFVREQRPGLVRWATSLTVGDAHTAEDLVQATLTRVYLHWGKARRGNPVGYARQALMNTFLDHRRRAHTRREVPGGDILPDLPTPAQGDPDLSSLRAALAALPPRTRATVILRHVEGLTVEETAHALGCTPGTVKSQTARGLTRLRDKIGGEHSGQLTIGTTPAIASSATPITAT